MDDAYELTGIHMKATAAPLKTYREDMALADSCMQAATDAVKAHFGSKIDADVRIIRTSEVMRWTDVADALAGMGRPMPRPRSGLRRNAIPAIRMLRQRLWPAWNVMEKRYFRICRRAPGWNTVMTS